MNPALIFVVLLAIPVAVADAVWDDAHVTFYGDINGGETMQGACGYGDLFKEGYGLETAALSTALFNNGQTCGACFEIQCVNSKWCKPNSGSIKVTATNFCPPNYSPPLNIRWCNPPNKHFDLSMKMFTSIAEYTAGIVPVKYRRVRCQKRGGVRFQIKGNPHFIMVLVYNVGGAGDVTSVAIRGHDSNWIPMQRNWGQNWDTGVGLLGQKLSFKVRTSDGVGMMFNDVASENWGFGQTFEAGLNIH
ncbi:unnamed protein product [Eruca vesicaria subsp. sativa]|uniref:Expansin n=1 Tax=Eruca vesicaria subsp. sativa TaxID=29727 RepID=A0ABC8KW00_ERUVS|nr:unnamed protein product [Eruca vesicaria subsp. sativa]